MISTDKAYIFGLVVGGGSFGESESHFYIELPYKSWGDIGKNPERASQIAKDIVFWVKPIFESCYGITCTYSLAPTWRIECDGDLKALKKDLADNGITVSHEMRKTAEIGTFVASLNNDTLKRRFIAGLADTIGSTNPNHRRFSDQTQIISFEFSGFNYSLAFELCKLFASLGTFADQILWNHPNMHSASDPYYLSWKKGTKLRLTMDDYTSDFSFAFKSKNKSALENKGLERKSNNSVSCKERSIGMPSCSCIHPAESSLDLPLAVRGGHYFHNRHYCCALGCPYAPYEEIDWLYEKHRGDLISPFPILHKDNFASIQNLISSHAFLKKRAFKEYRISLKTLLQSFRLKTQSFCFPQGDGGYPIEKVMDAFNYLIQSELGTLKGNRTSGNREVVLMDYLNNHPNCEAIALVPDLLSTLVLADIAKQNAVMIGARNPRIYSKLIRRDEQNKYKFIVRQITEEDFL